MFRNYTRLGIKHVKKKVTTKCLEKCLGSKHIFYSVTATFFKNYDCLIVTSLKYFLKRISVTYITFAFVQDEKYTWCGLEIQTL